MAEDLELKKSRIRELITGRRYADLRATLTEMPPPDLSDLLLDMERSERLLLFRFLPRELATEVFSHMDAPAKDVLLESLTDSEARRLLATLSPDDRTHFLEEVPGLAIQRLLNLLSHNDFREAMQLLGYPEESVGRLMTPDYVAVRPDWTIEQALTHIRKKGIESETINIIYVTDRSWKLLDALELKKLILAAPTGTVESLMDYSFTALPADADREAAVQVIARYDLVALPVVDSQGVLLGIVTVDDVLDVAEQEATEDFHRTAAVEPLRGSYRESGVWLLVRKRIGWLLFLIVINLVASGIIAAHEEILAAAIALAFFMPLLSAAGGNVGAQSATIVIRAQATGDIKLGQWLITVAKELRVGVFLGMMMAAVAWFVGLIYGGPQVALVVALSMLCNVLFINVLAAVMPFVLTRLGLDPAAASGPLITSMADPISLLVYFSMAAFLLHLHT